MKVGWLGKSAKSGDLCLILIVASVSILSIFLDLHTVYTIYVPDVQVSVSTYSGTVGLQAVRRINTWILPMLAHTGYQWTCLSFAAERDQRWWPVSTQDITPVSSTVRYNQERSCYKLGILLHYTAACKIGWDRHESFNAIAMRLFSLCSADLRASSCLCVSLYVLQRNVLQMEHDNLNC